MLVEVVTVERVERGTQVVGRRPPGEVLDVVEASPLVVARGVAVVGRHSGAPVASPYVQVFASLDRRVVGVLDAHVLESRRERAVVGVGQLVQHDDVGEVGLDEPPFDREADAVGVGAPGTSRVMARPPALLGHRISKLGLSDVEHHAVRVRPQPVHSLGRHGEFVVARGERVDDQRQLRPQVPECDAQIGGVDMLVDEGRNPDIEPQNPHLARTPRVVVVAECLNRRIVVGVDVGPPAGEEAVGESEAPRHQAGRPPPAGAARWPVREVLYLYLLFVEWQSRSLFSATSRGSIPSRPTAFSAQAMVSAASRPARASTGRSRR